MKKYMLVLSAAAMAMVFTAFTTKKTTTYWIRPGTEWLPISDEQACPVGNVNTCSADNPYTTGVTDPTPVYISQSTSDPLKKPN